MKFDFPSSLRVKIANLIKIILNKDTRKCHRTIALLAYQVDAEAVRMKPLLAHVARDHVLRLRLLANAKQLKRRSRVRKRDEPLT